MFIGEYLSLSCSSSVHRSYNVLFVSERLTFHTHYVCGTLCSADDSASHVASNIWLREKRNWNGRGIS
jgi:hypothetical protein